MGCGSSSLKGEAIHDLSDIPRSSQKTRRDIRSREQVQQQLHPLANGSNVENANGRHLGQQPDDSTEVNSLPPIKVINLSEPSDKTKNGEISEQRPRPPSISSAERFRAKMSSGSFSMSSHAPRKKAKELTDEDLLKHTGMTAEQLKQWGDQNVYRRQEFAGAGAAMGTTYLTAGAMAY